MLVTQKHVQQVRQGLLGNLLEIKRLGDGRHDLIRVADGRQRNEAYTVCKVVQQLGSDLQSQARFANSSGAG